MQAQLRGALRAVVEPTYLQDVTKLLSLQVCRPCFMNVSDTYIDNAALCVGH